MKTLGIIIVLLFGLIQEIHGQYNQATGKVKIVSVSLSPVASFRSSGDALNYVNASLQIGSLFRKGVYYSMGYTNHQNNGLSNVTRENKYNAPSFQQGHSAFASLELKKLLFTSGGSMKTSLRCFYKSIGLSIAPEYQYLFPIKGIQNTSNGEFSLRSGLYYHQGSTRQHRRNNFMFTVYYKKAFTPLMQVETPMGNKSYFYDEIGVRVSVLIKQLYRFDNFDRK